MTLRMALRVTGRYSVLCCIGVVGGVAITIVGGFVAGGVNETTRELARILEPLAESVAEARWQSIPGLRLSDEDIQQLYDMALESILNECEATPGVAPPEGLRIIPGDLDYATNLQGVNLPPITARDDLRWLNSDEIVPYIQVGPIEYSLRTVGVDTSYWLGLRLGISIDYECRFASGKWDCHEESRYRVNWPRPPED